MLPLTAAQQPRRIASVNDPEQQQQQQQQHEGSSSSNASADEVIFNVEGRFRLEGAFGKGSYSTCMLSDRSPLLLVCT